MAVVVVVDIVVCRPFTHIFCVDVKGSKRKGVSIFGLNGLGLDLQPVFEHYVLRIDRVDVPSQYVP